MVTAAGVQAAIRDAVVGMVARVMYRHKNCTCEWSTIVKDLADVLDPDGSYHFLEYAGYHGWYVTRTEGES